MNNGERTEEAFEAIECPEALDAVQDGRDMGEKHFETCMMCERNNNADHPFFPTRRLALPKVRTS